MNHRLARPTRSTLIYLVPLVLVLLFAALPGASARADGAGYALQFDGVNDLVELPYTLNVMGPNWQTTKTISLWIKPTGTPVVCAFNAVGFCDSILGDRPRWWGIARGVLDGQDRIWVWNSDGSQGPPADVLGIEYTPGEWVHVSLVHNAGVLLALRNGIQVGGTPSGATLQPNTGALPKLQLGGVINSASRNWTFGGVLDEVTLWSVPRTESEIQADMFRTLSGSEPGLRAYYSMSDGAGTTLSDDGPGGWDGVLRDGVVDVPPNGAPALWVASDAFGIPGSTETATATGLPPTPTASAPPPTATATAPPPTATATAPPPTATATAPPPTATATGLAPTATTPAGGFPSTGVLDAFNRADGALGSSWSGNVGSYAIVGNQLDVNGNGSVFWNGASFGADQEAYLTVTTVDASAGSLSLLLKSQSSTVPNSGVIRVTYTPASQIVRVWTYATSQGWVQRGANLGIAVGAGDRMGARARADGTVEIYRNGALVGIRDASGWPHTGVGGYVGLWMASASNVVLDDFGGGT